jgi:DNA-binding CsgD family transcriptional regulator
MSEHAFDRLTEKQKECLRLVLRRNSSKEIASELGISPHTVDARLKGALKALGTASRFEAARILATYEAAHIRGLAYQLPNLSSQHEIGEFPVPNENWPEREPNAEQINGVTWNWLFPLPTANQPVASFTPAQKLASVIVIVMATVFIMGSLLTSYEALSGILGPAQ